MNKPPVTVKEHDSLREEFAKRLGKEQGEEAYKECATLAGKGGKDEEGKTTQLFKYVGNSWRAKNYVGIVPLKNAVVEILPKICLSGGVDDDKEERRVFYKMLRKWRRFKRMVKRESADIAKMDRANMWEVFVYLFLRQTEELVRAGIVSRYAERTENLTRLKGRLQFPQQAVINAANRARFYVQYSELSQNHPANRLIRRALEEVRGICKMEKNRSLQQTLTVRFDAAPPSENIAKDWQERPRQDRSMQHYEPVLDWAGLFLHQHGLATFAGGYRNTSLLFPMEQVFEDYVTAYISRHAEILGWKATPQNEQSWVYEGEKDRFKIRPDIVLRKNGDLALVLDAKWKEVDENNLRDSVDQSDIYQMFAYAKVCGCSKVALVYPKSEKFLKRKELTYEIDGGIKLILYPFAVDKPEESARGLIDELTKSPA